MKIKFHLIPLLMIIFSTNSFSQYLSYPKYENLFNMSAFSRHINFLGSDLFEGRGTGTTGGNLAARYLALELSKIGLKPVGNDNTYYQNIPMHGSKALPSSKLILYDKDTQNELRLNDDYLLYQSGSQTFIPVPTQLVFVGYGIIAPEFDYNDYQEVDVEGKIVVFIEGEPFSNDKNFFNGELQTIYSYPESKQKIAISRGARGSILIPFPDANWKKLQNDFAFENITLAYSVSSNFSAIFNNQIASMIFNNSPYSFKDIIEMHSTNRIKSFNLNTKLSFRGVFQERDFIAQNVVGMLEGSDPKSRDRYLIVSAHYDHLGIGPSVNGDSIYNGVYDNAAGVSALLEIARGFIQSGFTIKRSILFLFLTGEESGLLGSKYYTNNPIVPLYKTIANINIDGIASFDNFNSIIGIGKEYSTLNKFLENTATKFGLIIEEIPPQFKFNESFSQSDQVAFASAGVPALLVSEGLNYVNISKEEGLQKYITYSTQYYHTPFDDLQSPINLNAAKQHMEILFSLIEDLANNPDEPEWNKGSPYLNARLRSIAEKK
ncbi:MAG: M20/M25/M40 family metallo-hydrolase [Ignavibacteria bacterium]|nr:M20/M25/M40 family metallo-hydrolase [Ignavibacteria bacterium]